MNYQLSSIDYWSKCQIYLLKYTQVYVSICVVDLENYAHDDFLMFFITCIRYVYINMLCMYLSYKQSDNILMSTYPQIACIKRCGTGALRPFSHLLSDYQLK